jgi:hypothetical protein
VTTPTRPSPSAFAERAASGATLPGRRQPGWHRHLAPHRLDVDDTWDGLLGQFYGHLDHGIGTLAGPTADPAVWVIIHRFDLPDQAPCMDVAHLRLTAARRAELTRRRVGEA